MSAAPAQACTLEVSEKSQLVAYLEAGAKSEKDWRIGAEHEKFVFKNSDLSPASFDGEDGIESLLLALCDKGWSAHQEKGRTIALSRNGANITLEPGGQFELSGAALCNLHDVSAELEDHLKDAIQAAEQRNLGFLGLGFTPQWKREDIPWMPKGRYAIMRNYMPKKGNMGLDMMQRTCTVQVNLDFKNEADMVQKFRVSMALQPLATALWANSPFVEGRPSGFLSTRSQVWTDTDPDRCGILLFAFEEGMGYERYVDWVLDTPMYFIHRNGRYIDASGQSFRDFLDGNLPALPKERPTMGDWMDHLTTVFPEVRLKQYLEMRGADAGSPENLRALPAFWVGLLYHQSSLDAAWDIIWNWPVDAIIKLRNEAPRFGLQTFFQGKSLQEWALTFLALSEAGLKARNQKDANGDDESALLKPIWEIAHSGKTAADKMLDLYHHKWNQDVRKSYEAYRF